MKVFDLITAGYRIKPVSGGWVAVRHVGNVARIVGTSPYLFGPASVVSMAIDDLSQCRAVEKPDD